MGKKKTQTASQKPDNLKELGNKAFGLKKYQEAIDLYTQAIEMSKENPNHVYFANRANSKLELFDFKGCIEDCDQAIKIDPKFIKSYLRKARAQHVLTRFDQALETVKIGQELDPENADFKEIESQLHQEIKHDKTLPKDHPERQKIDNLIEWMDEQGSEHSKIRLRFYESTHRGVHAACNINYGDIIMKIPLSNLMTQENAVNTPIGLKILEAKLLHQPLYGQLNLQKNNLMASFLLTEIYKKKEDPTYKSPYASFIDSLPKDTNDFPACFTEEEMAYLKGSDLVNLVQWFKQQYQEDYDLICKHVPEFKQFAFDDYKYAVIMSASRSFAINVHGKDTWTFAPLADMMNHKNPMENKWYFDNTTNCFQVEAMQNISFGEPIMDSYGSKSTCQLFLNYGFLCDELEDKLLKLYSRPEDEDIHFTLKGQLLDSKYTNREFWCEYDLQSNLMMSFIGFARWVSYDLEDTSPLHMSRKQVQERYIAVQQRMGVNTDDVNNEKLKYGINHSFTGELYPTDIENEVAAWKVIKVNCLKELGHQETTLQDDIELIEKDDKDHKLGFNKRNCVLFRKGGKKYCHYLIKCADMAKEMSTLSKVEAKAYLNQDEDHDKRCESYFKEVYCGLLK